MKRIHTLMFGGLAAAMLSFPAFAQTGPGDAPSGGAGGAMGEDRVSMGPSPTTYPECVTARNPPRCEARLKAMETCKDLRGGSLRACVEDNMPLPDCSKHPDPQGCEAMQQVRESCKGKIGTERKTCMGEQTPKHAKPIKRGPIKAKVKAKAKAKAKAKVKAKKKPPTADK